MHESKEKSMFFQLRDSEYIVDDEIAKLLNVSRRHLKKTSDTFIARFPEDSIIILNNDEINDLKELNIIRPDLRKPLYAYSAHGFAMICCIMNGPAADKLSLEIIKDYVKLKSQNDHSNGSLKSIFSLLKEFKSSQ